MITPRTGISTVTHVPLQVGTTGNIIFDPLQFPFAVRIIIANTDTVPIFVAYDVQPTTTAYDLALNGGSVDNDGLGSVLVEEGVLEKVIWAVASVANTGAALTVFSK